MTANPDNPSYGRRHHPVDPNHPGPDPSATPLVELTLPPRHFSPTPRQIVIRPPGRVVVLCRITNTTEKPVENLSGVISLQHGDETLHVSAIMPLNLLPDGRALPLIAYIQPPLPEEYTVNARVDFLLPVMPGDQRYLPATITEQTQELNADGRQATVRGWVSLPAGQPTAR